MRHGLFACLAMIVATAPALAAHADVLQRGESRAVLAAPSAKPQESTIDGRIWRCDGTVCMAEPNDMAESQHIGPECRHVASYFGAFTSYQTGGKTLTDAELADCNGHLK